jgi:hypothetical protein
MINRALRFRRHKFGSDACKLCESVSVIGFRATVAYSSFKFASVLYKPYGCQQWVKSMPNGIKPRI